MSRFKPIFATNGLQLTISSFSIIDKSGQIKDIAQQIVNLKPNSDQFIVLDTGDKKIKLLDRAIHDGAIVLGFVSVEADNSVILNEAQTIDLRKNALKKFTTKLQRSRSGGDVRIAILGDSLLEPSKSSEADDLTRWTNLLFNHASDHFGYNVTNVRNVQVDNYAIGSQTSHYGVCYAAEESIISNRGDYQSTALVYTPALENKIFPNSSGNTVKNPFFAHPYDLIIIGFGANGGTDNLLYLENTIIQLRKTGAEVLIVTQNYRTDNPNFLKDRGEELRIIADNTGCALADTWIYVKEKEYATSQADVFYDVIHMNEAGHQAYAESIRGVIDPQFILEAKNANILGAGRNTQNIDHRTWNLHASSSQVQFTPSHTTGIAHASSVYAENKNPAIVFGGKNRYNAVTQLEVGEMARFGHPYANSFDVIVDASEPFKAQMKTQGGNEVFKIGNDPILLEIEKKSSGKAVTLEGIKPTNYANITQEFRRNRGIQLECIEGKMRIIGVIFHCDPMKQLDILKDVVYKGAEWKTESWLYNHPISSYSDVVNSGFTFDFYGSEALIHLSRRTGGGIIDVFIDGVKIYENLDLYSTGNFIQSIRVSGTLKNDFYEDNLPAHHSVKVILKGENNSVTASEPSNRRLQLLGVDLFTRG